MGRAERRRAFFRLAPESEFRRLLVKTVMAEVALRAARRFRR